MSNKFIQTILKSMHTTDLGVSLFYNDIFVWDHYHKRKNYHLDHLFQARRVKQIIDRHESYLLKCLLFVETEERKGDKLLHLLFFSLLIFLFVFNLL
jgi:hypothetical protein